MQRNVAAQAYATDKVFTRWDNNLASAVFKSIIYCLLYVFSLQLFRTGFCPELCYIYFHFNSLFSDFRFVKLTDILRFTATPSAHYFKNISITGSIISLASVGNENTTTPSLLSMPILAISILPSEYKTSLPSYKNCA